MKKIIEEWKKSGAWAGIVGAPLGVLGLILIISTLFYSCEAKADWLFPEAPIISLYVEAAESNPFCASDVRNELSSNISIRQNVWVDGGVTIGVQMTHHSCGFKKDVNVFDGVGIGFSYQPK